MQSKKAPFYHHIELIRVVTLLTSWYQQLSMQLRTTCKLIMSSSDNHQCTYLQATRSHKGGSSNLDTNFDENV